MKYIALRTIALTAALSLAAFTVSANDLIAQGSTSGLVNQIQQRLIDLDYFNFKPTSSYGGMSRSGAVRFQEIHSLVADGTIGEQSMELLFSNTVRRNAIPDKVHIPIGPQTNEKPAEFGEAADWFDVVNGIFTVGKSARLTDLNTGKSLNMTRTGGQNHALVETDSQADTDIFLEIFGGEYNWSKRPMMAEVDGNRYAASLQGMPGGADGVSGNGMDGGCALYFANSTSDTGNLPDEEHRRVLIRASGMRW